MPDTGPVYLAYDHQPGYPEPSISGVRASCVLISTSVDANPSITGAGEGIRTLDPNLGKVVLYP
jgi:hypothetical protein